MGPWPGFGRRVSLAAGGERTRNPAGRIRIRPLRGVDILGLENPKGERNVGPDPKRLEDPNRPVPGWGQPAGGGGGLVRSCVWSRTLIAQIVFTRAKRVAGSGVLKVMSSETEFTIGDLAVLMITISDNTASQMLFDVVGHNRLQATIERLGMTDTRIPLSPQDMLLGIVGLDATMGPVAFDLSMERLLHRQYDFDARAYSSDGNVSTPADMCRLFQRIHSNEVLSPEGTKTFLDVHKNQQLRTVIPHLLPAGTVCAHKTGQFESVSCDVGIVYAENGPYAIAIMANDAGGDRTELNRALAALSRSVFDRFARSGA